MMREIALAQREMREMLHTEVVGLLLCNESTNQYVEGLAMIQKRHN